MSDELDAEGSDEFGDGSDADIQAALEARFAKRPDERPARRSPSPRRAAARAQAESDEDESAEEELDDDEAEEAEGDEDELEDEDDQEEEEEESDESDEDEDAPQTLTLERFAKQLGLKGGAEQVANGIMVADADGKMVPLSRALQALRAPERAMEQREQMELRRYREHDEQRLKTYESGMRDLSRLTQVLLQEWGGDEPDWKELKASNPTEYSVRRLEHAQRSELLRKALATVEEFEGKRRERASEQYEAWKKDQARKLQASRPEWKNRGRFQTDVGNMVAYLRDNLGFTDEELEQTTDHRHWAIVWKAMQYDRRATKQGALERKLKDVKRVPAIRPGPAQESGTPRVLQQHRRAERKALAALEKSGSDKDAEALILARIQGTNARQRRAGRGR